MSVRPIPDRRGKLLLKEAASSRRVAVAAPAGLTPAPSMLTTATLLLDTTSKI